jgi:ribonuclease BN (tRNA processing enzyme)
VTLTLTVLGCDGSFPGPGGAGSGFLVRGGGATVWLDCGPGTLANLQRHVRLEDVDAIVITHEHPDHRTDVEGFAVANEYFLERLDFPVYAPAGVFDNGYHTDPPALEHHLIDDGDAWKIGALAFRASKTDHVETTLAVRIELEGRSLAYSADTGAAWSLAQLGEPVDLALVEASYTAEREAGHLHHLSGREAGMLAREAGARRVVLTHFWPTEDRAAIKAEAEASYGGPVELAAIDAVFEV